LTAPESTSDRGCAIIVTYVSSLEKVDSSLQKKQKSFRVIQPEHVDKVPQQHVRKEYIPFDAFLGSSLVHAFGVHHDARLQHVLVHRRIQDFMVHNWNVICFLQSILAAQGDYGLRHLRRDPNVDDHLDHVLGSENRQELLHNGPEACMLRLAVATEVQGGACSMFAKDKRFSSP
jgi:hypothetical protein